MGELDTIHNGDQPMAEDVPQNPTTSPASDSDSDSESNYDAHVQAPTSNIHSLKHLGSKNIEMIFCLLFRNLNI